VPVCAVATYLHLITCTFPEYVLKLLTRDLGACPGTGMGSVACWYQRGAHGKLMHHSCSGCCIDCDRTSCPLTVVLIMSIFFVRNLVDCALNIISFMTVGARDLKITVETGDNVIGVCDISPVASDILWYQLIPHC
jgi:hypothetical protein